MSEKLGQVCLAAEERSRFLEGSPAGGGDYSEETSRLIDAEIRDIIATQYEVALSILRRKQDVLTKGARTLLEKEKIEREEIESLFKAAAA